MCLAFKRRMNQVKKDKLSLPLHEWQENLSSGPQTEIDSPQPYLGDSMDVLSSQGTVRRRGGGALTLRPAEYRWSPGPF